MLILPSKTQFAAIATPELPFVFTSGEIFDRGDLAFKTYGTLNADRSNGVLVFPVLTTSQNLAGFDSDGPGTRFWTKECHRGWWDEMVGPGKAIDTDRFYVICANYLGGCFGSLGPETISSETGHRYGRDFPRVSVEDMVNAQIRLLDELEIFQLHAVIGASFGGLLAYDLSARFPDRVKKVVSLASGMRVAPETRHSNLAQIFAIESDPEFQKDSRFPETFCSGLALARLIAMKTYVQLSNLETTLNSRELKLETPRTEIGNYLTQNPSEDFFLRHSREFCKRFSPESYLRILGAWQTFRAPDLSEEKMRDQEWLIFTIQEDGCFSETEQNLLISALEEVKITPKREFVMSDKGHDAFLCEASKFAEAIRSYLEAPSTVKLDSVEDKVDSEVGQGLTVSKLIERAASRASKVSSHV